MYLALSGVMSGKRSMKSINARMVVNTAFCFSLFFGFFMRAQGWAEEYYVYRDANGKLVISNQQPPPGSTIIKRQNLPETFDNEVPRVPDNDDMSKGRIEGSPETPKNK